MNAPGMPVLLADTNLGRIVVSDGIIHILTLCCKASGKGSGMGVVCRACYRPVPDHHGWAALADDTTTQHHGQHVLAGMLRPSLAEFAEKVAADLFVLARTETQVPA